MGDDRKNWEDEMSISGFGIVQGAFGIPNKWPLTKGELSLQQQERIAQGVEIIVSKIHDADYEEIVNVDDDDDRSIEALGRVNDALVEGFEDQLYAMKDVAGSLSDLYGVNSDIADGIGDLNDTAARIEDIGKYTLAGVGAIAATSLKMASDLDSVRDGMDNLNGTAEGILAETSDISEGVWELTAIGERQAELMKKIGAAINKHGKKTTKLLSTLAALTVEHIRLTAREHELNRMEIRRVAAEAVTQIVFTLNGIEANISKGLAGISGKIAIHTKTVVSLAENSEAIKGAQYREQGRLLLESNHAKEAISPLQKAYDLNAADFETNRLLAQAYERLKNSSRAFEYFDLAASLSKDSDEIALLRARAAFHAKAEGNNFKVVNQSVEAIQCHPAIYYSELNKIVKDPKMKRLILLTLLADCTDDLNILTLCAVEFIKLKDSENAELAVGKLTEVFDLAHLDPVIHKKLMISLPNLLPIFRKIIDEKAADVDSAVLLQIA